MRLYGVYDEPHRTTLVLELVRGSNLHDRVVKQGSLFGEKTAAQLASDVMSALKYLHSMLIVHRDLKPENLMFGSDDPQSSRYLTITVCDLGKKQLAWVGLSFAVSASSSNSRATLFCL